MKSATSIILDKLLNFPELCGRNTCVVFDNLVKLDRVNNFPRSNVPLDSVTNNPVYAVPDIMLKNGILPCNVKYI